MIKYWTRMVLRRFYRRRQMAFFAWDVDVTGPGKLDPEIRELDVGPRFNEEGPRVFPPHVWQGGYGLMMIRMRRGQARAYVLNTDGAPVGYCFTQDWGLFERSMGFLGESRLMLGPGWTDPAYRGRGFFGRMMNHAVYAEAQRGYPRLYGVALVSNTPSRKGIERTGAICLGCHEVREYLWGLFNTYKALTHLPARVDTPKHKPA
ncbi:MAG: hypothetical protein JSU68_03610 [Phycisphaerales bacterium]|nr:MAG: hypothetical protein JSU68_03610 [Phycisphaerales bacterium]